MKRRLQHRSAVAGLALVLALGAAGCSEDAPPAGSPVPSDSSSATPSASVPALPDEARGRGPEAAEAFVRHYVDLINAAMQSLDSGELRRLATSSCAQCKAVADLVDRVSDADGRLVGGEWRVDDTNILSSSTGKLVLVRATIRIEPGRSQLTAGAEPSAYPGTPRTAFTFSVARGGAGWMVERITGLSS